MAFLKRIRGTGGRGEDRKKTPKETAEERIEAARKSKATELDLTGLGLTELPASIGRLAQLRHLNVAINQLTALPQAIGLLTRLQSLEVSFNLLTEFPKSIGKLAELRILSAVSNMLEVLPEVLGQLTRLQSLNVTRNLLKTLPESLLRLTDLKELYVHDNPTLGLPPDLAGPYFFEVQWGGAGPAIPAGILDYYFKMTSGRWPLNEVRLLLVGRGAAGKTSIVRRLVEDLFTEGKPETKGIDIRPWELLCGRDTVRAHVWDFAGQVITHATHQFFLSHRSVYVLVLTGREDSEKLDTEYWLRLIRAFGTEPGTGQTSPVIMVLAEGAGGIARQVQGVAADTAKQGEMPGQRAIEGGIPARNVIADSFRKWQYERA